jgi:predicted NUDIX family NTP pyrophosphohydrolase
MTKRTKRSAGLLLFRRQGGQVEVFLAHMGGPFWARKDYASWSIPKGEFGDDEVPFDAAKREFREETGLIPTGRFIELAPVKQPGGKMIFAWAVEWDCDPTAIKSNTFTMEWPRGSGRMCEFPEIDRAAWFALSEARRKILKGQAPLLDQLGMQIGDADRA